MQQQSWETEIKRKGSKYPHQGGKTACSAYGQTSRRCGKWNHFEIMSKGKRGSRNTHRLDENEVSDNKPSDKDVKHTFSLSTKQA